MGKQPLISIRPLIELFRESISGQAALRDLAEIISHHRIQSSPGFREAARFCLTRLRDAGIPAEILSFPADGVAEFWGHPLPQEWNAQAAVLRLVAPEKEARVLADYREEKISLIQRSLSTPADGVEAAVVVMEDGEEEEEYQGLDLGGKIVLTRGNLNRVRQLAVGRFGAIGIIYDGMREAPPVRPLLGLPEARQYTSFWWETTGDETPTRCFGFVLSPQEGERLRRLVRKETHEGRAIRVHACVDASFYAGHHEVVEAFIPGEIAEEVWLIAHLCHPQPSANDNASGAATLLEVARAITWLITEGRLPKPYRGIRFLLPPEMNGTYAYLATHEAYIPKVVAALNLDMVGEDQAKCGSTLLLTGAPLSSPSLSDDLLALILDAVAAEGKNFMGVGAYPLFRWAETPFSGGSDHYILADPTVGIPCPMLIQWPDRFYHTTADTLDKVDPEMLARVGTAAATYLWWLASASLREAAWLGQAMVARAEAHLGKLRQVWLDKLLAQAPSPTPEEQIAALDTLQRRLDLIVTHRRESLKLLQRLAGENRLAASAAWDADIITAGQRELGRASAALSDLFDLEEIPQPEQRRLDKVEGKAQNLIPHRTLRGPFPINARLPRLSPEEREEAYRLLKEHGYSPVPLLAMYWTNGERTLLEIADLVELESGQRKMEVLVSYYELLEKLGLIKLQQAG
jgi:hypothetical protein